MAKMSQRRYALLKWAIIHLYSLQERLRGDFLLIYKKKRSLNADLVAEGRDMTTVVFPDAWKNFILMHLLKNGQKGAISS